MRLKLILAGLLMLLPFPALADVTARYSAGPKDQLVIEAAASGNTRISLGEKFAVIRRDGVDFVVAADAAGNPKVARLDGVLALIVGQTKVEASTEGAGKVFQLNAGAEENVAGYSGMTWLLGPAPSAPGKPVENPLDIVISTDPALAPIGVCFRHLIELASPMLGPATGETGTSSRC